MNTRSPRDKTRFNFAVKNLKELIISEKNRIIEDYLENLSPTNVTDYSLWKATKGLKQARHNIPPIRKSDKTWAINNKEKAETFGTHLFNVFRPFPSEMSSEEEDDMQEFLYAPLQMLLPIKAVKRREINTLIRNTLN